MYFGKCLLIYCHKLKGALQILLRPLLYSLSLRVRAGYLLDIEIQIGHKISRTAMADATDYVGSYKFAHHWTEEWFL